MVILVLHLEARAWKFLFLFVFFSKHKKVIPLLIYLVFFLNELQLHCALNKSKHFQCHAVNACRLGMRMKGIKETYLIFLRQQVI
jgi:hypothetical protein